MPQGDPLKPYDLGILLVHGIGNQTRGSTLTDFGTPLIDWISRHATAGGATASVCAASLTGDEEPAHAELAIQASERSTRWLLAESWWAQSFPVARFSDVARWGIVIVPWAIGSHFAKRLSRVEARQRGGIRWTLSFASALLTLVGGLLLSPLLVLMLAIMTVLGKVPIPQLQSALARLQSPIASSLGDSYMFVIRPIEAAAIQAKILADLNWLTGRCKKVAVIAHSQGAALAARVISNTPDYEGLLITFGSGLRKLEELESVRDEAWITRGAWLTVAGIIFVAITVTAAPVAIVKAFEGTAASIDVLIVLGIGAFAVLLAVLGLRDLLKRSTPPNLYKIINKLTRPNLNWTDIYASADPVPNGALRDDGGSPPQEPIEVTNLGSVWSDHTTYWNNRDEFVGRIAHKLLALDTDILPPSSLPNDLVARRRRSRIWALRAIQWVTVISVAAILVRYRADWLQVTAWTIQRGLAWAAGLVGWSVKAGDVPAVQFWQRSLGWLLIILAVNWITRTAWNRWNTRAMKNDLRDPFGLMLTFGTQVWLAVYLTSPAFGESSWGFGVSLFAAILMTFFSTFPRTSKLEPGSQEQDAAAISSPERAGRLVWNLLLALVTIGAPVWFYFIVVPRYLADHPWARWFAGIVLLLIFYAVVRERRKRNQTKATTAAKSARAEK